MNIKAAVWFGAVVFLCVVNVAFMLTPNHTCTCDGSNHTFGAINLKVFGATKWSDPEKRPYLTDVSTTLKP